MASTIAIPDLGNNSQSDFLQKPEWTPVAQNEAGLPKNTENLAACVDAILHDALRKYFAEINAVFRCEKTDIPLFTCIADGGKKWREGDDDSKGLTLANMGLLAIPAPQVLLSCNATPLDEVDGVRVLTDGFVGGVSYYAANAPGSKYVSGQPNPTMVWGLRNHKSRWYRLSTPPTEIIEEELFLSCQIRVPHWNQSNSGGFVALSWANVLNENQIGTDRGWEFGLGPGRSDVDAAEHPNDLTLYFKFWTAADVPVIIAAELGSPLSHFGLLPGGEYQIGALMLLGGSGVLGKLWINGIQFAEISRPEVADIATHGDMNLIVGSRQAGFDYVGAIRNVYVHGKPSGGYTLTAPNDIMAALYKLGSGYS